MSAHRITLALLAALLAPTPLAAAAGADAATAAGTTRQTLSDVPFAAVVALPAPEPDLRASYGDAPQQFGELYLPDRSDADDATLPFPVVMLIHGGCWLNGYGVDHARPLAGALRDAGVAVWSIEYRRIGDPGGGWPGTAEDVTAALARLAALARAQPLDLERVVAVGHSAGGHLALWLGARSAADAAGPVRLRGVVGLAAISDPVTYATGTNDCQTATPHFLGGMPADAVDVYAAASPLALLPDAVETRLLHGAADSIVPTDQSTDFVGRADSIGTDASIWLLMIPGAGHFDMIHPGTIAFTALKGMIRDLMR